MTSRRACVRKVPIRSSRRGARRGATRYLTLIREDEAEELMKAVAPYTAGEVALTRHELVTSTDLGRRHRPRSR
jgi:hypothetical protein